MRLYFFIGILFSFGFAGYSQGTNDPQTLLNSQKLSEKAESVRKQGHQLVNNGEYESAVIKYKEALSIFEECKDSIGIGKCYNNLGFTYSQINNGVETIKALYKAIEINKLTDYKNGLVSNYINLGVHYEHQEEYSVALKYYFEAKRLLEEHVNSQFKLAVVYGGLGIIYGNKDYVRHNYDSSYFFLNRASKIHKSLNSTNYLIDIYNNIGVLFSNQRILDSALFFFKKSYNLKDSIGDRKGLIISSLNVGRTYMDEGNYGIALPYLLKGKELAIEYGDDVNYLHIITNIIKCKIKLGDVEEAEGLFAEYNTLNDSIYDQEKARQLKELETIYETEKTGKELENQIRQTRAQTRLSYTFLALAIGIGIVSAVLILFFMQRQRFQQKLKDQELDRMRKDQEIKELNAMMQGQEEERNRIAEDLHDRLGARLSAIKLLSEQEKNGNTPILTEMLEASIKETREISHNLSTDMLTRFGLANAIRDLVNTINSTNAIEGDFTTTNLEERLPVEIERSLYHMTSELINNTIKHAKATSFFIQITKDDDEHILSLLYEDDGQGFDFEGVAKNGMGMKNLRARVEGIGGELIIDTSPGNGMHVMANIPMSMA